LLLDLHVQEAVIKNYETVPRTAHARAIRWMLPSSLTGRLARMCSRNAARRSLESDMQYPGAGA
jgi:hypothetical protein